MTPWGFLWSLPITILGLLLVLFSLAMPRLKGAMLLCEGDRGLAHLLLTRRGFSAITLGRVVTTVHSINLGLWMHELEHARQAEFWGPLYVPAYLYNQVRYGYNDNPFEIAAVQVEKEFRSDHPAEAEGTV